MEKSLDHLAVCQKLTQHSIKIKKTNYHQKIKEINHGFVSLSPHILSIELRKRIQVGEVQNND